MNRDADLQRAFELIENDSLDEARAILDDILASDKQNADAWWLYAHTVTEADQAQRALNNVVSADPDYPGAQELLNTLKSAEPATATGIARLGAASKPAVGEIEDDDDFTPDFLDDLDDDDLLVVEKTETDTVDGDDFDEDEDDAFDFDDEDNEEGEEDEEPGDGRRRIFLALIALVVLFAAVFVVFVVKPFQPAPQSGTATQQIASVGSETAPPTVPVISPATETPPPLPEQGLLEGVYNALSGVSLVENSASVEQTSSGNTLAVSVCAESRRALRTFVPKVMKMLASQGSSLEGRFDAVGVRFLSCDANSTLLYVALRTADAAAFANGSLSEDELEARFVSISQ